MKITIELEHDFGHPGNRPSKEYVIEKIVKQLPDGLKHTKDLGGWHMAAVRVDLIDRH